MGDVKFEDNCFMVMVSVNVDLFMVFCGIILVIFMIIDVCGNLSLVNVNLIIIDNVVFIINLFIDMVYIFL